METWNRTLLPYTASLREAVHNLDESAVQIILIVSSDNTLIGTITDGDIRRGLLRGLDLNSTVDSIVHHNAMVVSPHIDREVVLHLMQMNSIHALPVVDEKRHVIGLHLLNELLTPANRPNIMVIMAGGKGTRLRPYTENCPKPLLPISGKPMLEHIIERAKKEGFRHFMISVHYLGEMIQEYFGDGSQWNVQIEYIFEKIPLGTAGALGLLKSIEQPFLVTNGDVLTDIRYGELLDFHLSHQASATMAVRVHEWQNPFGVVHTKGVDIVGFEEKPIIRSHVNAGIYVLNAGALKNIIVNESIDMPTIFSRLQDKGERTIVYPMHEPWLDVGCTEDLERAQF